MSRSGRGHKMHSGTEFREKVEQRIDMTFGADVSPAAFLKLETAPLTFRERLEAKLQRSYERKKARITLPSISLQNKS